MAILLRHYIHNVLSFYRGEVVMRTLRVKRAEHDPHAAILTSTGWLFPDGTFKPHYAPKDEKPMERPGFFARWFK